MGRMGREFELWRRLRTSEVALKLPPFAPWWEVKGGSGPDVNTSHRPLPQRERPAAESTAAGAHSPALRSQAAGCMQGGWGRRAPSWVHRRG